MSPVENQSGPLLAGIDVGTTNIKAVIFDLTGQPVTQASVATPTYYPQPGWAHYEPEELWQGAAAALRQATGQLDRPDRIAGIAIASMAETAIPLDAHNRPTYHSVAWFDRRTQPQVDWLERNIGAERMFEISGMPLQPIFGLCKLLWFKQNEPAAYSRTVRWLNVAEYIAYRLCGVQATDYSLACRVIALNLRRREWDTALLQDLEISPSLFAPLCDSGTRLGPVTPEAAAATGLPTTAQVGAGGHDHICGALAIGVIEPGDIMDSMGTSEPVFVPLNQPISDPMVCRQGYAQGAHAVPGRYYATTSGFTSGASVEWFRDIVGRDLDYATLIGEAEAVAPGSLGVYFMPHLRLANTPHYDPKGRGAFIGLSTDAGRGVLFRALLEGLAYDCRYALEPLFDYPEVVRPRQIYAIGGSTRNPLLMRIKAAVFNRPITVATVAEATSLGAAILGGLAAGVYADLPSALQQLRHKHRLVEPDPAEAALYDRNFRQVYQQLYHALKPLHHTIYQLQN
ncbi:MAG: carbohydrate kinase [Anaerolineales bacterium]|nr:carbohydrate kinase [Anaerolineales bacterium]